MNLNIIYHFLLYSKQFCTIVQLKLVLKFVFFTILALKLNFMKKFFEFFNNNLFFLILLKFFYLKNSYLMIDERQNY